MTSGAKYRQLRAEGKCVLECGQPAVASKSMCAPCAKKVADQQWRKARERQAQGLCQHCNRPAELVPAKMGVPEHVGQRCTLHRKRNQKRCKNWTKVNGKKRYDARVAAGMCANSPTHGAPAPGSPYCESCRLMYRQSKIHSTLKAMLKP